MTHSPSTRLSKSRFCYGLQCPKQLWWRVHEPDAPELAADPALQLLFERGHRIGELARERFPGGVLIDGEYWKVKEKVEKTCLAIAGGAPAIFEASFVEDGVFVAVDVIERRRRGWALAEVKSTLDVKEAHIPDVAIQLHVARVAGLDVRRAEVMHLDRACRFPDLSNLFARDDVTGKAEALLPGIKRQIAGLRRMLAGPLPEVEVGDRCADPYECPFAARCRPELPPDHVSTLYKCGRRAETFLAEGYQTINDLPDEVELPAIAARQVRAVREGRTIVEPDLAEALARFAEPVAFLDFETIMPVVPVWPGCHPYEQVPVQMSCHVTGKAGRVRHHEFLAEGPADPRPAVAEAVVDACARAETVVAYNAGFESRCLEHLALAVPDRREELRNVGRRLVDLLPIVRDNVYHPLFGGSFGLKSVAPALLPGMGYGDLEIGEGGTASAVLEGLLLGGEELPAGQRKKLRRQLLDYCERDTLVMVKVVERLRELSGPYRS